MNNCWKQPDLQKNTHLQRSKMYFDKTYLHTEEVISESVSMLTNLIYHFSNKLMRLVKWPEIFLIWFYSTNTSPLFTSDKYLLNCNSFMLCSFEVELLMVLNIGHIRCTWWHHKFLCCQWTGLETKYFYCVQYFAHPVPQIIVWAFERTF